MLLNPNPSTSLVSGADEPTPTDPDAPPPEPHRDERQIHLDTERSFVFYPAGEPHPVSSIIPSLNTAVD